MQIGSDVAWMFLIEHAKNMTSEEATVLSANVVLFEYNKKKRD